MMSFRERSMQFIYSICCGVTVSVYPTVAIAQFTPDLNQRLSGASQEDTLAAIDELVQAHSEIRSSFLSLHTLVYNHEQPESVRLAAIKAIERIATPIGLDSSQDRGDEANSMVFATQLSPMLADQRRLAEILAKESESEELKTAIVSAIGCQSLAVDLSPTDRILERIVLEKTYPLSVRRRAVLAIAARPNSPKEVVQLLRTVLQDQSESVELRSACAESLESMIFFSPHMAARVIKALARVASRRSAPEDLRLKTLQGITYVVLIEAGRGIAPEVRRDSIMPWATRLINNCNEAAELRKAVTRLIEILNGEASIPDKSGNEPEGRKTCGVQ